VTTEPLSDKLERLAKDATPGLWGAVPMIPKAENYFYIVGNRDAHNREVEIGTIGPSLSPSTAINATLIVELRNALETIIAALRKDGK
jgi:hypothetical protein